jgi:plastocyanin
VAARKLLSAATMVSMKMYELRIKSTTCRRSRARRVGTTMMVAAFLLVCPSACVGSAGSAPPKMPKNAVKVKVVGNPLGNPDSLYVPATIHIVTGQTVVWLQTDDSKHTVTPEANIPPGWSGGSSILSKGQTYAHRFNKPGTFRYHCMVHPNMFGSVIVTFVRNRSSS